MGILPVDAAFYCNRKFAATQSYCGRRYAYIFFRWAIPAEKDMICYCPVSAAKKQK